MHNTKGNLIGSSLILISAIGYGFFGVWARLLDENFGAFSQHGMRCILTIIFYGSLLLSGVSKWKKIEKKDIGKVLVWAFSGAFVMPLLFVIANNLSLGTAYFLFYSTTLISCIFTGKFVFKEKMDAVKWFCILLVLVGFYIIFTVDISSDKVLYVFLALLAGALIGFWSTYSKNISSSYSNAQMLLIDGVAGIIVATIGFSLSAEKLGDVHLVAGAPVMIGYVATLLIAANAVVAGFRYVEAQIGGLIMPLEVVFASFFGYLCFGEELSVSLWIGGSLIFTASILPHLVSYINERKSKSIKTIGIDSAA